MFAQKLKNKVKDELMRYEKKIITFNEFIETFIELNDKLYKRVMNRKHIDQNVEQTENYINH